MTHRLATILLVTLAACHRPAAPEPPAEALLVGLPAAEPVTLTRERAARLVALSLACVAREFPNKPSHVYDRVSEVVPPSQATPAFFGCFDWHSAVHGHWTMVRLLRLFPDLPEAEAIRAALDRHLTPAALARELAFFREPRSATFERPYGWAWLLRLGAELHQAPGPDAARWREAVTPLATHLAVAAADYLERLSLPVRSGQHQNTAFALAHLLDYARVVGDEALVARYAARARAFYLADRACPVAYEPSGEDFVSPCLAEADVMRRVLAPEELARWLEGFLPPAGAPALGPLRAPAPVSDLTDPKLVHLVGLSFQRAWCFADLAKSLPPADARGALFTRLAALHQADALAKTFAGDYAGEHWLASFAVFSLTSQ